jgi:dienelactone hydrolase
MEVKNKKGFRKTKIAIEVMQGNLNIEVVDNLTILSPYIQGDTALIFYPGAKVEHIAYLPILKKLTEKGITCVLVEMPFNMAIFDSDAAEDVFEKLPEIKNWYIGGHSMGGAMASSYAAKNKDKIEGLILLGAYVYGDYPAEKALTVYGTFNSNLEEHIDYTENIVVIEGGNHAQFGNYGEQKGDPKATISAEEQQNITVDAILNFIQN